MTRFETSRKKTRSRVNSRRSPQHGHRKNIPRRHSLLFADLCEANEGLSDVALQGSDGSPTIPASRFLLAARSRVFRSMLYGSFVESTSSVVSLAYRSEVLEAIVYFCTCDSLLEWDNELSAEEETSIMIDVIRAAHFYAMEPLEQMAFRFVCTTMEDCPSLAPLVLETSKLYEMDVCMNRLRARALDVIRHRTKEALLPNQALMNHGRGGRGVLYFENASSLASVVGDDLIHAQEIVLFQCVQRWSEEESADNLKKSTQRKRLVVGDIEDRKEGDEEDRAVVATSIIASCIKLSRIKPSDLRDIVAPSCLVSTQALVDAYATHAHRAERAGFTNDEPRSTIHRRGKAIVQGAGVSAVNGEYVPSGTHDGVQKYTKSGMYRGVMKTFTIFRFPTMDGTRRWYMSIVPTNFLPGSDDDHDFYFAQNDYDTPFGENWMTKEQGVNPAPICFWEADEFEDD